MMTKLEQKHIDFLNDLRDSNKINMMSAAPHLTLTFGLKRREAKLMLLEWMKII